MANEVTANKTPIPWQKCEVCVDSFKFKSPREFVRHLRDFHCTKEGGSFICRYGPHHTCPKLPIEGVSNRDYEEHLLKSHLSAVSSNMAKSAKRQVNSDRARSPSSPVQSSTEPSIVQDQHKWTPFMSKVNLPAVLNDPTLGRRETDIFTKTWGETFERAAVNPSPHLQEIGRDHFNKYVRKLGTRLQTHKKTQALRETSKDEIDFPAFHARLAAERSRAELEAIPQIYLLSNFSLENQDTFSAVFPWNQIEQSHQGGGKRHSSSKLLQEKLSHYLDLVEVQISRQISLQSEAFFKAVCSQDKITENIGHTKTAVTNLREKMRELESQTVQGPLKVMKLAKVRANYVKVLNKLKLMGTVHQTQPTIQLLLATNEFVGALDLISTTREVLTQELPGVHCFRHLGSQLAELEKLIDAMMQEDFVRYAAADLNRPLEEDKVMEEERLVAVILGMLRKQHYNFITVYKEESCTAIKAILKQTVIEAVTTAEDISNDNNAASLADQMRLLNYDQWMKLLAEVFANLLVLLRRIKNVVSVMMEVVQVASGPPTNDCSPDSEVLYPPSEVTNGDVSDSNNLEEHNSSNESETSNGPSPVRRKRPSRVSVSNDMEVMLTAEESNKVMNGLQELLCLVCDHAHDRCVKLIVARSKDGFIGRLSSSEFVQLSHMIENFVDDCQEICGRKSMSLRSCLQSEANKFVNRFHEDRKNKLSLILDNERWKQADVPAEFQHLVNHVVATEKLTLPDTKPSSDLKPEEYLQVNGKSHAVVGTVLLLLKMVVEYCQCVLYIPSITADILTRLVELLKMFNSRTCQLILGAGALQLVGLKTITTKNLALASRCLQLVLYFLPQVRTHFEVRLSTKQGSMLKHFDHVIKDYSDHIVEIDNKLVAIMETMIDMQIAKWEVKAPMPSVSFRNICKQIGKLHEAIHELLPPEQVQQLFDRVIKSFRVHLRGSLIKLGVTNDGGPQHGLVSADLAFFTDSIRNLAGLDKLDMKMEDIWDKR